jgi:hypothetical protein
MHSWLTNPLIYVFNRANPVADPLRPRELGSGTTQGSQGMQLKRDSLLANTIGRLKGKTAKIYKTNTQKYMYKTECARIGDIFR